MAREIKRDADQRWLATGDFNDVAWSGTTRLFQDLADLKDPRVGRRLLNIYHTGSIPRVLSVLPDPRRLGMLGAWA